MPDPNRPPGQNLDLSNWKIQLPITRPGSSTYLEVSDLGTFQNDHFRTGADGGLALSAPVDGVTTAGARYARSELRELTDAGGNAAWTLAQGGRLAVVMEIDTLPQDLDGTPSRIVIGQVHGGDGQLVRLYYQDGQLTWCDGRNEVQTKDTYHTFQDAQGRAPDVGLNERFAYGIDVSAGQVSLWIEADGTRFDSSIAMPPGWSDNTFYLRLDSTWAPTRTPPRERARCPSSPSVSPIRAPPQP